MAEYIEREAMVKASCERCIGEYVPCNKERCILMEVIHSIPAADVRPVVVCADCKHNNACLTQAFVEDASRVPFDRSAFFCADGERKREES